MWLDATYVKVRQAGRNIPVAVILAVAVNDQGRREMNRDGLTATMGPTSVDSRTAMTIKKTGLYSSLWQFGDELRSVMDAIQYNRNRSAP